MPACPRIGWSASEPHGAIESASRRDDVQMVWRRIAPRLRSARLVRTWFLPTPRSSDVPHQHLRDAA